MVQNLTGEAPTLVNDDENIEEINAVDETVEDDLSLDLDGPRFCPPWDILKKCIMSLSVERRRSLEACHASRLVCEQVARNGAQSSHRERQRRSLEAHYASHLVRELIARYRAHSAQLVIDLIA